MVHGKVVALEMVQCRRRHLPAPQRVQQGVGIVQGCASRVHEHHAVTHGGELGCTDHPGALGADADGVPVWAAAAQRRYRRFLRVAGGA